MKSAMAAGSKAPIADAARTVGIGYAFAYGIAKRDGLAEKAAGRRPEPNGKMIDLIMFSTGLDRETSRAILEAKLGGRPNPTLAKKAARTTKVLAEA